VKPFPGDKLLSRGVALQSGDIVSVGLLATAHPVAILNGCELPLSVESLTAGGLTILFSLFEVTEQELLLFARFRLLKSVESLTSSSSLELESSS